jgi:hypothetical protein
MSTRQQRNDFISYVIADDLLDTAIEWISQNMAPEEMFDESTLTSWAHENDMRTRDETAGRFGPEDVFEQHVLRDWAEANGYVEEQ